MQLILCRSEAERERAAILFPRFEVQYANGGTDWTLLEGRRVVSLGIEAATFAIGYAVEVKLIEAEIPPELTPDTAVAWAKANAVPYNQNPSTQVAPGSPIAPQATAEAPAPVNGEREAPSSPASPPPAALDTEGPPQDDAPPIGSLTPPPGRKRRKRAELSLVDGNLVRAPEPEEPLQVLADGAPNWPLILQSTKAGYLNNLDNVVRVIENDPTLRKRIWYDEFLDSIVSDWQDSARRWRDSDDVLLQLYIQRHIGLTKISVNTVHDAALVAAFRNVRNECREWLAGLAWDGTERLSHILSDAFGAEQTAYTASVGRCWFISMCARVMEPGCKVDTVPVLEGAQGVGKSSALKIIGGKWFAECHESVLTKDWYGVLDGHMLVEISEMHSFTRGEVERVKGLISCQVDRYRKAYGRNTEDHPRQSVLVCTTNRDDWQRDETGARRFWPVLCGKIELEWLTTNRDYLFAEALHLYREGVTWWMTDESDQEREVERRRDVDSWEPTIAEWLKARDKTTTGEVLSNCINLEAARQDVMYQRRVARVMRALKWKQHVIKDDGVSRRVWLKPR